MTLHELIAAIEKMCSWNTDEQQKAVWFDSILDKYRAERETAKKKQ